MKKIKELLNRIPRPCRGLFNLAAIILLAFLFYTSISATPLSRVQGFRRMERANFVGPSKILFNGTVENLWYDNILVAESEYGVSTYIHHIQDGELYSDFNYFPKTGSITVVSAPQKGFLFGEDSFPVSLPVFVVDDHPEAKRAELSVSVSGIFSYNSGNEKEEVKLDHHFSAESYRKQDGIFHFTFSLPYNSNNPHGGRGFALDALAFTFSRWVTSMVEGVDIIATVRLYDKNDTLITEQTMPLKHPNA